MSSQRPLSDADLFSDATLLDPYPTYRNLRDLAGAVWMTRSEAFAVTRFDDVRSALRNWRVFSSGRGVGMNEPINERIAGNTLSSDPPRHSLLRQILARPLSPPAMRTFTEQVARQAETIVERLVAQRDFDAATDLAQFLPTSIISFLVGLPEQGRERMLEWGHAAFNTLGPLNQRCLDSMEVARGLIDYAMKIDPAELRPDGWAALAFAAAARGEITLADARLLILDYVGPSLDTTIFATSSAIWLFGLHPDQWQLLCNNPALIPGAINEVVRLESPIQIFSRYVTSDTDIDGVVVPAGSRAMIVYGSANRDERQWDNPDIFDIRRKAGEQLAFGHGIHMCVGMPLARLELRCLLEALVKRVKRFELGEVRRARNNTLRGLEKVAVKVH